MKKIIILTALVWVSYSSKSQTADYQELIEETNQFYEGLDYSDLQTNYFFNKGFVVLNGLEEWYEGYPIISSIGRWKYIYEAVVSSQVSQDKEFPEVETLIAENSINTEGIPTVGLSILNFKGDYLTIANLEGIANQELDEDFVELNIFAGTVLKNTISNATVEFEWNPDHYFTNYEEDLSIAIDFGDNYGFREVALDEYQTFMISYEGIGEKSITFRSTSDNEEQLSYSKIIVSSMQAITPTKIGEIVIEYSEETDLKDSDPNIQLARADYDYHEGIDETLDKPVIITEGFDILGTGSASDYSAYYEDLIQSLTAHGYDVFVVNFRAPNHTLQTNAELIKELIRGINDNKVGNYEGIYIGESMGGVIGRIALKEMENDNYDHQIGLFVPYDSPFKGANLPLGMQWLFHDAFWSLGSNLTSLTFIVELIEMMFGADIPFADLYQNLTSPSAKQLFVRHFLGNEDYNNFQTYLSDLGYPSDSRNVSFINGSHDGDLQGITLGQKFLDESIFYGIGYVNAQCWYSDVNVTDQTVSKYTRVGLLAPFSSRITNRKESFDNSAFDNAPGGNFSFSVSFLSINTDVKFSFVPTLSAIDIDDSRYIDKLDYYNANEDDILNNNESPFDDIYSQNSNQGHVRLFSGSRRAEILEEQEIMFDNMYLQNRTIVYDRDFEAEYTITAGNDVQPAEFGTDPYNSSYNKQIEKQDFVVKSGVAVNMEAETMINLKPGFHTEAGSHFKAKLVENPTAAKGRIALNNSTAPPVIIGNKFICGATKYSVADDKESISWTLKGYNTEINYSGREFTISQNLKAGQYTLYCSNGFSSSSKIVVVSSDENCNLFSQFTDNSSLIEKQKYIVSPNPSNGVFTVRTDFSENEKFIIVRDLLGQVIYKNMNFIGNTTQVDLSPFPFGIYIIEIHNSNNAMETHKVIKR